MKVLLVDQYGEIGGGQTVFLQVMEALVASGTEVEAAIPPGGGLERAIRARLPGTPIRPIDTIALTAGSKGARDMLRLVSFTARFVRDVDLRGFEHVYVNGPRLFPACLFLAQKTRARFTYHLHIDHTLVEKAFVAALLHHPRTHAVLVNSPFIKTELEGSWWPLTRSPRLVLLENALTRAQSGLGFEDRFAGALQAVVMGRVIPQKGQHHVIELARRHPSIHFHLLGDADFGDRSYLEALRACAGANVTFHGRVADVHATIRALGAQVCLVPSQWDEPFGLVAIEAMAMSCLTITSGRGGLGDIARRTGAWVCRTAEAWEAALQRLTCAPRPALREQARAQHAATLQAYAWPRFQRGVDAIFGR